MDRVCLITGGARGIGRATARLAGAAGYAVAVGYRTEAAAAEAVASEISSGGGRAVAIQADVAEEADVLRMFEETERSLGPVTALVNSAGISHRSPVADFASADLRRIVAVNVVGLMLCCREAVRRMSTIAGGQGGAIVNVSSMAATMGGRPGASAYAAAKAAVDTFSTGLAKEVAAEGIRVNVVRPGATRTDMTARMHEDPEVRAEIEAAIPMHRFGEAHEVAAAIMWLLSDQASFVSGAHLDVSGGGFIIGGGPR
jgi:NAD(P)-dependent dehydrogenase (short-subunit alcohol dehydrogenase family)